MGIVTGVTLRLAPPVHRRGVTWAAVPSPGAALAVLREVQAACGDAIEGFELIPQRALENVVAHVPGTRAPLTSPSPWHVLIEAVSAAGEPPPALEPVLARILGDGLLTDAVIAASEAQADAFWRIRDAISEAERAIGPAIQHDISVPVSAMPGYIDEVPARIAATFPGATSLAFGHLGDGNVHFHIRPPGGSDPAAWLAEHGAAASRLAYNEAIARGGSISAEHGIGRVKRYLLADTLDPARLAILRAMKTALDPAGLLNPGVLI